MKKDIEIPIARHIHIAAVHEWDDEFLEKNWYTYLINDRGTAIEMVLIVSTGYEGDRKTATLRHRLGEIPAKHFVKIEMLQEDVLTFNNEFFITFFLENKLYERRFIFDKNSICTANCTALPLMDKEGVLAI
ncbi:MAG TPA: hypothetical protein VLZ54_06555 [Arenibacter sp.]|nr:hypothetical protein [Arenibacter sp.]